MKMKQKLKALVVTLAFGLTAQIAHARQILNCTIGDFEKAQGQAKIEILSVVDHPKLKIFKIDLVSNLQNPETNAASGGKKVHLKGFLAAQLHSTNGVVATGLLRNAGGDQHVIINPPDISLQGYIEPNGEYQLRLYDENRQLQLGYGVRVVCR